MLKDGTIILNRDDKFFSYLSKKVKYNKLKLLVMENQKTQMFIWLKQILYAMKKN